MKVDDSLLGVAFVVLAVFLLNLLLVPRDTPILADDAFEATHDTVPQSNARIALAVELPRFSKTVPAAPRASIDPLAPYRDAVAPMLAKRAFLEARAYLVERAAVANAVGDATSLGYILSMLGEVATESLDFGAAELFLGESLEIFKQGANAVGEAYAYMQLGRMHIKSRAVARHAGRAYDLLLVARNQLHRFQYEEAEANLRQVVRASREIDRYGTAASALETLSRVEMLLGRTHDAENALLEAAELHAASGRETRALALLAQLDRRGVDPTTIYRTRESVHAALQTFRDDIALVRQAGDYRSLYYQYRNAGNQHRAWELRIKAARLLAQTSRRAMYYRQPDVMAILYNSNRAMDRASEYVTRATVMFATAGQEELASRAGMLEDLIF